MTATKKPSGLEQLRAAQAKGKKAIADGIVKPAVDLTAEPAKKPNPSEEIEENGSQDMVLAAQAIFDNPAQPITLSDGRVVQVREATMSDIPKVMLFFGSLMNSMDSVELTNVVKQISARQKALVKEGYDPKTIDLKILAMEALSDGGMAYGSFFAQVLAATFTFLPDIMELFTDMSREDHAKLKPDDGSLIVGAVFLQNYSFFTRSLPPIFKGFMRSLASKK